jgi:hypothetical protein
MGSDLLRSDKSNLLSEVIMARLKIRADSKVLRRREKNQEQEGSVRAVRIDYRAYVIGPDGHIAGRFNDADAKRTAERLVEWQGSRYVTRLEPKR